MGQYSICFDGEGIGDGVVMDGTAIQNGWDGARMGGPPVPCQNFSSNERDMRDGVNADGSAAQREEAGGKMVVGEDEWLHGFPSSPGPPLDL